jgi:hypothetical protein
MRMKLHEFLGIDCRDDHIVIGTVIAERLLERADELDTSALLYAYKNMVEIVMPAIASERVRTWGWRLHPKANILSPKSTDRRATEYQYVRALAQRLFDVLQARADALDHPPDSDPAPPVVCIHNHTGREVTVSADEGAISVRLRS